MPQGAKKFLPANIDSTIVELFFSDNNQAGPAGCRAGKSNVNAATGVEVEMPSNSFTESQNESSAAWVPTAVTEIIAIARTVTNDLRPTNEQ